MTPVSLTYAELQRLLKVAGGISLAAAAALLAIRWTELQTAPARVLLQVSSAAIGVPSVLLLGISKLHWTRPWLAWMLGRRMVHGLWWGTLESNYEKKDGQGPLAPIEIAFVIKQTYFFLSINSYTQNQPAKSTLESLVVDSKSQTAQMQYVFEMRRLQYGENKLTFGFGDLTLHAQDKRLEGFYWTNSPTAGRLSLQLVTRDCDGIYTFEDAQAAKRKAVA